MTTTIPSSLSPPNQTSSTHLLRLLAEASKLVVGTSNNNINGGIISNNINDKISLITSTEENMRKINDKIIYEIRRREIELQQQFLVKNNIDVHNTNNIRTEADVQQEINHIKELLQQKRKLIQRVEEKIQQCMNDLKRLSGENNTSTRSRKRIRNSVS
jgi:hypothetical protein